MTHDDPSPTNAPEISVSMGEALPGEISPEKARQMGIAEWRLSDAAIEKIKLIESNIRLAESHSGIILVS